MKEVARLAGGMQFFFGQQIEINLISLWTCTSSLTPQWNQEAGSRAFGGQVCFVWTCPIRWHGNTHHRLTVPAWKLRLSKASSWSHRHWILYLRPVINGSFRVGSVEVPRSNAPRVNDRCSYRSPSHVSTSPILGRMSVLNTRRRSEWSPHHCISTCSDELAGCGRTYYYMKSHMHILQQKPHVHFPLWVRDFVDAFEDIDRDDGSDGWMLPSHWLTQLLLRLVPHHLFALIGAGLASVAAIHALQ